MKQERFNPYTALLNEIKEFVRKLKYPHTVTMFTYEKERLTPNHSWRMDDVYQRVQAAKSLGYEAIIETDGDGMKIVYRKKTEAPFYWQP